MYPYNPQISSYPSMGYNPVPQNAPQLIRVNGIDSAKAYQTQPNSTVALFDSNEDIMYIKSTDASNFPTIRRFRFIEEPEVVAKPIEQYVTISEFEKFKEEILNGKQSIQQSYKNTNEQYSANKKSNESGKSQQ